MSTEKNSSLIETQLKNFRNGFPFLPVIAPATVDNGGIEIIDNQRQNDLIDIAERYEGTIAKFVPASGAATRMFKDLFEAQEHLASGEEIEAGSQAGIFMKRIREFPFMNDEAILNMILGEKRLGYGSKPKGLIVFHDYKNEARNNRFRTAFEEHLVEGALYAKDRVGDVHLSFTVSPEHKSDFEELFNKVKDSYQKRFNCTYHAEFTLQDPSTDTIAVDLDNNPFLKEDGEPLFRPGGHGALLANLNLVGQDIVVIKNVDNVVREEYVGETVQWKKILIGRLIESRNRVFAYLKQLESVHPLSEELSSLSVEIGDFLRSEFRIELPMLPDILVRDFLMEKLNRPIRVCGMVKNVGEPGGGPFIVRDYDGSTSRQILESSQLDMNDDRSKDMMKQSTHFNPVDVVALTVNYQGEKFDLNRFVNPLAGFISEKSYQGKKIKAQELPGLWNGAMSNWNTIFVEVPMITFNPVKSVIDLLRKEHRG